MINVRKLITYCVIAILAMTMQTAVSKADEVPIDTTNTENTTANTSITDTTKVNADVTATIIGSKTVVEKSITTKITKIVKKKISRTIALRNKIVKYALRFEGNPYVWGGTSLTRGADCSGFTQSIFRNMGFRIPRTSRTQATGGKRISLSKIKPGDLLFYRRNGRINHVAIFIGNGKVISASSARTGIRITKYNYRQPYKAVSYIN